MIGCKQVKKDFQELVLSANQDRFFRSNMYKNFGDIGAAVKDLVDEFQRHSARSHDVSTVEEMQAFVENYSEFSAAQRNASKHVTLISTLSSIVDSRTLMQAGHHSPPIFACIRFGRPEGPLAIQVSSAEQEVCCSSNNLQSHYEMINELVNSPHVADGDRLRLVLLFALRYEQEGRGQVWWFFASGNVPLLLPMHQAESANTLGRLGRSCRHCNDSASTARSSERSKRFSPWPEQNSGWATCTLTEASLHDLPPWQSTI